MAATASGIEYPTAGDFIAPLNAHLQTLAETTQEALDERASTESTTYTPTFTGFTLGNGTVSARYSQVGNIIFDEIIITLGSTSEVTGVINVNGLQPSLSTEPYMPCGNVTMFGNGSASFGQALSTGLATRIALYATFAGGSYTSWNNTSATIPFTWTTGNKILIRTMRFAG
jgi:hypothetical protein